MRITQIEITPLAFADPPLLNSVGVHEPYALRSLVRIHTDAGITGLSEGFGDEAHLRLLRRAAPLIVGADPFATGVMAQTILRRFQPDQAGPASPRGGPTHRAVPQHLSRVLAAYEVACLDIQGHATGRPVHELLGGAVRDRIPFSAYLFYKWDAHPGRAADDWGVALDADGIVRQAQLIHQRYGFASFKLKGGVYPPEVEAETIRALRAAFPEAPLRLDPNAVWSIPTAVGVAEKLSDTLEYLEDPVDGIAAMAEVHARTGVRLATNMCVTEWAHLAPAFRSDAVQVVLTDHHQWGGLRDSQHLAVACDSFDVAVSMHSNSHLGVSLAAMLHLGAAIPRLDHDLDTHWPWRDVDIVDGPPPQFQDGCLPAPTGPGLGVNLDEDAVARLHERYLTCGQRTRDDTGYLRRFQPDYSTARPRW